MSPHDKLRRVIEDIIGKYYCQGQIDQMKGKGWLATQQDVDDSLQTVIKVLATGQTNGEAK